MTVNAAKSGFTDDAVEDDFKPLTAEQAEELRKRQPPLSPWRVIASQALVGVIAALIGWLITRQANIAWSLLYGAAVVVVPNALLARGMTRRYLGMSPGSLAVSFMLWEFVKIGISVAMLAVANRIVQPLVWPALLVGLVLCAKVYLLVPLWHRRAK